MAAICFGSLGILSRLAADAGLETLGFVTWRSVFGAVGLAALLGLLVARGAATLPRRRSVPSGQRRALLLAAVANVLTNAAIFSAFAQTSVAITVIILYSYPALVTLASSRLWAEPIDRVRATALGLASLGLMLVVLAPLVGAVDVVLSPPGMALAAGAAVLQATYSLLVARGFPAVPSLAGSTLILGMVVVGNVTIALALGAGGQLAAPAMDPTLLGWAIVAGILGAAVPGFTQTVGIRRLGASRAAILMMLEPVVAVSLAALVLREELAPIQVVGGALVIGAGIVLQQPARGRRPAEVPGSAAR